MLSQMASRLRFRDIVFFYIGFRGRGIEDGDDWGKEGWGGGWLFDLQ